MKKGACLASQHLREKVIQGALTTSGKTTQSHDGKFTDADLEARIQPASFEPRMGNEIFILDTETYGLFKPGKNETVYRALLQIPHRQRPRFDISGGFEVKRGFTYLVPLEERVVLEPEEYIKSSPKSSVGRIFFNTRMIADDHQSFNLVTSRQQRLQLWLVIQPQFFNGLLYPGMSINQLRFFRGYGAQLTPQEIFDEWAENPLLYHKSNAVIPSQADIIEGIKINLDLLGEQTSGVIGLRALHNPTPIDLRKKEAYAPEDFFEPLMRKGQFKMEHGKYYLFASKEILKIPPHLSIELRSHSDSAFTGPSHFAGFGDNGFEGDLVFEARSDESVPILLEDGWHIAEMDVFKTTTKPDKLYSTAIGSHYHLQRGPRAAKYFKPFDYENAARNQDKLLRTVLVQDARKLLRHRKQKEGFETLQEEQAKELFSDIKEGFFHLRYDCETDETLLQPIPYVVLFGPDNTVWTYVRARNIKDYGDKRLFEKHSLGYGGHITPHDAPRFIESCIEREVLQEEIRIKGNYTSPQFRGTLFDPSNPIGRVHFGLIYTMHVKDSIDAQDTALVHIERKAIKAVMNENSEAYENWSRILIPHLSNFYSE